MKGFDAMSQYQHLTINEREKMLILFTKKQICRQIARAIGRSAATVSRKISRNKEGTDAGDSSGGYSAIAAQQNYEQWRKKCRRHRLLDDAKLYGTVKCLFWEEQWSPKQIANRLSCEKRASISYNTIYRAIYGGEFDTPKQRRPKGNRGAIRSLRHRGKTRRAKRTTENRGKIVISNQIQDRPSEAANRTRFGHWEADTVAGKTGSACLVTIVDMRSRYLLAGKQNDIFALRALGQTLKNHYAGQGKRVCETC